LRIFISFPSGTVGYGLIILAAVDRWFPSSAHQHRHRMISVKNVKQSVIIIIFFSIILYIEEPICYEINPDSFPLQCYSKTKLCYISIDLTYGFITILLTILLMKLFTFSTILTKI
jgi:hypothetical protein